MDFRQFAHGLESSAAGARLLPTISGRSASCATTTPKTETLSSSNSSQSDPDLEDAAEPFPLEAEQICAFIRQTTKLDPHTKPGPQLVAIINSIFSTESVAIFDADLG